MEIYLVGGAIRDKLLGQKVKDLDYTVVLTKDDFLEYEISSEVGFLIMRETLLSQGYRIFLSTPKMYTIRAKFPKESKHSGLDADFVLARKEVGYVENSREPILELGTLYDDLLRRDFTVNAIAEDLDGNLIDPFNGKEDLLLHKTLKTPGLAMKSLMDDPLRILRALRFNLTKGLGIDNSIIQAVQNSDAILDKLENVVSSERIREEVHKMFKYDTLQALSTLGFFNTITSDRFFKVLFKDGYWLKMTNEKKK
jgi:poly(A) polymerase